MHRRFRPKVHRFCYRVSAWLFDLDELETLDKSLFGFSINRFNWFSLKLADHGPRDGSSLRTYAEKLCADNGLPRPARLQLLCYPRMLGFAFNPLSIFFCADEQGAPLATIYEVRNTFRQRHSYVIADNAREKTGMLRHRARKVFYVSPFMQVDGHYHFRIHAPDERILVGIRYTQNDAPMLHAVFDGKRVPLNSTAVIAQFLRMPLMTLKIVAAINWEALRLWLKGIRLVARPKPPATKTSLGQISQHTPKQACPQ